MKDILGRVARDGLAVVRDEKKFGQFGMRAGDDVEIREGGRSLRSR